MLDVETLARLNRVYRVTGDWMLFSMLVTGPMIILASYVTSEILAPVGLVLFAVALSPLLFFTLMMGLASFNLFGIMDGELWRYLEATLDKAVQLKLPLMSRGEETRLTSVEWTTARFLPRRGRLTLTNLRLVFQRPRLLFLWPRHRGPVVEVPLTEIEQVVVTRRCFQRFFRGGGMDLLIVTLRDGSELRFQSMLAAAWRKQIRLARQAALRGT
jgi:hypothetical protein